MTDSGDIRPLLGMFGGTFDPIHHGHLRPALEILEAGAFDQLRLIPASVPPHREQPAVSPDDRLGMLSAAVEGVRGFVVDDRELRREGPSYSVDTLESLGRDFPNHRLCLIVGMDAFLGLQSWDRWERLAELAHLVVMERPGSRVPPDGPLDRWLAPRRVDSFDVLRRVPAGRVIFHSVTQLEISATAIRDTLQEGRSARYLVPETVLAYIHKHRLYGVTDG